MDIAACVPAQSGGEPTLRYDLRATASVSQLLGEGQAFGSYTLSWRAAVALGHEALYLDFSANGVYRDRMILRYVVDTAAACGHLRLLIH